MSDRLPLQEEYVIFTGILRNSDAVDLTLRLGGNPVIAPLISTEEIISTADEQMLLESNKYHWFIFTSQSSVHAFHAKIKRFSINPEFFQAKIAVVGSQTAAAIKRIGFSVDFTPTTFSADVFVKEFPKYTSPDESCLFFRGNLAKNTITNGLTNKVDVWTIYETVEVEENRDQVRALLEGGRNCSLIFTSPSAAKMFHENIGIYIGYDRFTICAIGHITKNYLESLGAVVHVIPETYTLIDVIKKLAKWKGRKQ
ncbi:uroporphyrinogen-III synthase [Bacillus sp. FJAT-22090]|uniref:uroporphyrinogen-III synthase n=1 Tax=Bacillus sp. FJAT-22090 TaxID=1581038 RepID=UPI0011A5CB99|nr:uroporphyrinogen-III synthase [Bacillus sp. FJAT-22090]